MLTLTVREAMCSRVCPLNVLNSATGAGNETMLVTAICLATDAMTPADERYRRARRRACLTNPDASQAPQLHESDRGLFTSCQ
jgi:hypothetical protein